MRFYNIALTLLSVCGIANAAVCKSKYDDEVINNTIKDIAVELNISECQAGEIYDFIVEGNNYFENSLTSSGNNKINVNQCKWLCTLANSKIDYFMKLKNSEDIISIIGEQINLKDLDEMCKNNCNNIPEVVEIENSQENESPTSELVNTVSKEKRATATCDAVSKGKINLIESNYQYNVPRYQQDPKSVKTAIVEVNGCGPKITDNFSIGQSYTGLFLPACNSHDVCYDCQMGKSNCDKKFLANLKSLCNAKYDTKKIADKVLHTECVAKANIMYKAVDLFAGGSYKKCGKNFNSSTKCAFCGNSIVHNYLVNYSFYIKK
ncbi:hypothetical protein BCR36DRAFT_412628 [Piromyces finnis]|uniref:Uncharacterized protein n=1 Tax=Piromyces finnis TaxID=1754191 RepID=A0A1Y1V9E6_9FUNG|nr:hypothetical protein BCR36DRAFT_412628 [Piromyces finnis]|eukprot:ORX49645.1 hypothetical protein BCR36DRAFT_412628 [Piromyces finnis]